VGWAEAAMMRRLYAAADLFVIPSLHEACGLTQMEAQRYGAVPVVRQCGGLADTVVGHTIDSVDSTGFVFKAASGSDFLEALTEALTLLATPAFVDLQHRCMDAPAGWDAAVEKYESLYRQALVQTNDEHVTQ
ncbi:MAG: glycosyltransferase, partial [Candidatus Electrothrix sp. ATG2]|nr:glycosyltransferase [Candidatus Electrothrix sp. ATG2]